MSPQSDMDTQHLRAFITVARLGSFTQAADQLHLTQPAISKRISALEEQLNCQLFDRINRRISLTPAGRALLPRAENILSEVLSTEMDIANMSGVIAGKLRIITSHHIGLHRLPMVLKTYQRDYPEVSLEVEFLDSDRAYAAIETGSSELAVITLSGTTPPQISSTPLWNDPLSLVIANHHPLTLLSEIHLSDLVDHTNILPDQNSRTGFLVHSLFADNNLTLAPGMTTNYLETIKMMVSIGLGWGVLPDNMLDHGLVPIPTHPPLTRQLGYIHHQNRTLSNAALAFIDVLQQSSDHKGRTLSNQ